MGLTVLGLGQCVADFAALREDPDNADKARQLWTSAYFYGHERLSRLPRSDQNNNATDQLLMGSAR